MLCMTTCAACSKKLQPVWKYCIYCGARVESEPTVAAVKSVSKKLAKEPSTETAREVIPSAIRPGPDDTARAERSPLVLFGWLVAGIGVILVAIGIVIFLTNH
jgi:hypothetical protein